MSPFLAGKQSLTFGTKPPHFSGLPLLGSDRKRTQTCTSSTRKRRDGGAEGGKSGSVGVFTAQSITDVASGSVGSGSVEFADCPSVEHTGK